MTNLDFWTINANAIISFSLALIAISMVYIAFKLFKRDSPKS